MSCPSCGHTMGQLDKGIFWCERCGSVVTTSDSDPEFRCVYVPKLVERCRAFERKLVAMVAGQPFQTLWRRLGINESIHLPETRKEQP